MGVGRRVEWRDTPGAATRPKAVWSTEGDGRRQAKEPETGNQTLGNSLHPYHPYRRCVRDKGTERCTGGMIRVTVQDWK